MEPMKRSVRGLWKLGRHRSCGMVPGAGSLGVGRETGRR